MRAAWPDVVITLRADSGLAVPAVYPFWEQEKLRYAIGYATNPVLERCVAQASADMETYYRCYGSRDPWVQRFEEVKDYQAGSWPHPRRVVAPSARTPGGSQRRFVVTNRTAKPDEVYRDFYVQGGVVPEQPIGELKNGLRADRLSACGFWANAWRLLVHGVAYALEVLFREANAQVPAVVGTSARRVVRRLSAGWPLGEVFGRVLKAVASFAGRVAFAVRAGRAGRPVQEPQRGRGRVATRGCLPAASS